MIPLWMIPPLPTADQIELDCLAEVAIDSYSLHLSFLQVTRIVRKSLEAKTRDKSTVTVGPEQTFQVALIGTSGL